MSWVWQEPHGRVTPDAQSELGRRRSRLSSSGPPRVTQMVAPMLKPADAAPRPQRSAGVHWPARAATAATRRSEGRAAGRDVASRLGTAAAAAAAPAAESAEQPLSACDEAENVGGALFTRPLIRSADNLSAEHLALPHAC